MATKKVRARGTAREGSPSTPSVTTLAAPQPPLTAEEIAFLDRWLAELFRDVPSARTDPAMQRILAIKVHAGRYAEGDRQVCAWTHACVPAYQGPNRGPKGAAPTILEQRARFRFWRRRTEGAQWTRRTDGSEPGARLSHSASATWYRARSDRDHRGADPLAAALREAVEHVSALRDAIDKGSVVYPPRALAVASAALRAAQDRRPRPERLGVGDDPAEIESRPGAREGDAMRARRIEDLAVAALQRAEALHAGPGQPRHVAELAARVALRLRKALLARRGSPTRLIVAEIVGVNVRAVNDAAAGLVTAGSERTSKARSKRRAGARRTT
jgi:hypothetical protein